MSDDAELVERLAAEVRRRVKGRLASTSYKRKHGMDSIEENEESETGVLGNLCQWTTSDGNIYFPASVTKKELPPGAYEICQSPSGLYFEHITVKTTDLVQFPEANSDKVIAEIKLFWESRDKFNKFKMPYKRGICLWGPPGSGKSCTVQFVMRDVVARGGIVIKFDHPGLFIRGYRILREIQRDTPVIVIMEDIDAILDQWSESAVLNILDGAVDELENVVFLATTNYPEKLGARVINRPSRFDRRFKIGFPNPECRRIYFEHLFAQNDLESDEYDVTTWVKDTEDMSIAHLRELFVAVVILENGYTDSVAILKTMSEDISSSQDHSGGGVGFYARKVEF